MPSAGEAADDAPDAPGSCGDTLIVAAAGECFGNPAAAARWLMAVAVMGRPHAPQNRAPSSISTSQCGQRDGIGNSQGRVTRPSERVD
jgi:hypothetical protein